MRWKLAFGLASDDLFFVTMRRDRSERAGSPVRSKIATFLSEDEFLGHLIRAGLGEESTTRLARAVLLAVAKPASVPAWTAIDLTQRQLELLHLTDTPPADLETDPGSGKDFYLQAARSGALPQFYDLLMQAPVALCMVMGPEHRYSFLNAQYAATLGIKSPASALGTSILDSFAGAQRQRAAERLDRVYVSGEPFVGVETPREFFHEIFGRLEERFFNSAFQPITNAFGDVAGVMIKTTDVTEMVLARQVKEHREQQLYRQWAELDAIYRSAPVAMMLIDVDDFRVLRLNEKQAELLGGNVADLLGRPLLAVAREPAELRKMLAQVRRGGPVTEHIVEGAHSPSAAHRYWLKSCAPILSATGKVESIILVGLEISRNTRAEIETVALGELELMV